LANVSQLTKGYGGLGLPPNLHINEEAHIENQVVMEDQKIVERIRTLITKLLRSIEEGK